MRIRCGVICYAVIDTNVLVSALLSNHADAATGKILPDMKDLPFYEVVMEKREENAYLVTGNLKHFPSEPFIVTARQMLDILDGKR